MFKKFFFTLLTVSLLTACTNTPTTPKPENGDKTATPPTVNSDQPRLNEENEPLADVVVSTESVTSYKIFLIALEDDGKSGKQIGCGDSIVGIDGKPVSGLTPLSSSEDKILAAYSELLDDETKLNDASGLQNTLSGSSLKVNNVTVAEGKANVSLTGTLVLGGVCDNPRVEAQLVETALQFPDISEITIMLNGESLQDHLSLKGE